MVPVLYWCCEPVLTQPVAILVGRYKLIWLHNQKLYCQKPCDANNRRAMSVTLAFVGKPSVMSVKCIGLQSLMECMDTCAGKGSGADKMTNQDASKHLGGREGKQQTMKTNTKQGAAFSTWTR